MTPTAPRCARKGAPLGRHATRSPRSCLRTRAVTTSGGFLCATVVPQSTPRWGGYLPREGGLRKRQNPVISSHNASNCARLGRLRIPVAVLAFFLQIATFEGVKMAFGGRIGGRPQKNDVAPARLERAVARADIGCGWDRLAPVAGSGNARVQRVRAWPRAQVGHGVNYARRQQYRRLARAARRG